MNKLSYLLMTFVLLSFTGITAQFSAQTIVDKVIKNAGGTKYDKAIIYFTFRGKEYRSARNNGNYKLERLVTTTDSTVRDVLSNNGLSRFINNCEIKVIDSLVTKIGDGVNSVHYFANLPYGLNAPAVHKELVGESKIKGSSYYKIKVTFDQQGGGTDFEDEFMYWIHKENFSVDYLAYKYAVDGGGIRFREAYNPRVINGIRFVDYHNYKTDITSTPLSTLDLMLEKGQLKLLSNIELEDIFAYVKRD